MNGKLDTCHCCEGLTAQTPVAVENRPGLSAIAYRVGTHSQFKQSMLARCRTSIGRHCKISRRATTMTSPSH